MDSREKRQLRRGGEDFYQISASFEAVTTQAIIPLVMINFHFRGACLRVERNDRRVLDPGATLNFLLGRKCIHSRIRFRICWEELDQTGTFGVEFAESLGPTIQRHELLQVDPLCPLTLTGADPIHPTRQLSFRVVSFSDSELILHTSAHNSFLFPGMQLNRQTLTIPGKPPLTLDLYIEDVRTLNEPDTILVQVTIRGREAAYRDTIAQYALVHSPTAYGDENRLSHFADERNFKSKALQAGLDYRIIDHHSDYEKVLKLRLEGYAKEGKVKPGTTWQQMGEGLKEEGRILGVFLAGQLVASVELRFGKEMPLRYAKHLSAEQLAAMDTDHALEPNRMVVHPRAQGTDVVMGMFRFIHAMAVTHGHLNVQLLATDKLLPFYQRIGARSLNIRIPHPVLTHQFMNLMLLSPATYSEGKGINPFFWSQVYKENQEYFSSIGISSGLQGNFLVRLRHHFGRFLFWVASCKKKKSGASAKASRQRKTPASDLISHIDPKWTRHHLSASIMLPYLLEAESMIGPEKTQHILNQIGVPRSYFLRHTNWFSMAYFDEFIEQFRAHGEVTLLQIQSGRRGLTRDVLGLTYYYVKHFASIESMLSSATQVARRFNATRTFTITDVRPGYCLIHVGFYDRDLLPKDPSACLNWIGTLEGVLELTTHQRCSVNKLSCVSKGDNECRYEARWDRSTARWTHLRYWGPISALSCASGAALLTLIHGGPTRTPANLHLVQELGPYLSPDHPILTIVLPVLGAALILLHARLVYLHRQLVRQFDRYHQESDERYTDLQQSKLVLAQSVREANLLENLAKEVQKSDELTKILNTTLSAVCDEFGFSRASIMLADTEKTKLRTVAVVAGPEFIQAIWNFSVDISTPRDSPLLLSSVYHMGQPALITDVTQHVFALNEPSRFLVDQLKTPGFTLIPIPAAEGNWGVLIADKYGTDTKIQSSDLTMLQRVCQHLGLALDKKAKFTQEENLRRLFEKYVPARVIAGLAIGEEPTLGGTIREITCMFIDIRGFTHLSEKFASSIILDVLNQFFTVVQEVIGPHRGVIDKFLGDGVLVTWGTAGVSQNFVPEAILSAREILDQTINLSESLVANGLPELTIGVGIHCGAALVGNVGSSQRMDFTAIGRTVNIASRLENLCKTYDAQAIVSKTVLDLMPESERILWQVVEEVKVRGVDEPLTIGVLSRLERRTARRAA